MTDLAGTITSAARSVWWIIVVRGVVAIAFGVLALFYPESTAKAIVIVFGIWALADGVMALVSIVTGGGRAWGWLLLEGVLGIAAGVIAFREPAITVFALVLVIAFWSLMIGVLEISGALQLRQVPGSGWGWLLAAGIASLIFGILLIANPGIGAATVLVLIGIYAIVVGVFWLISAFMFRRGARQLA